MKKKTIVLTCAVLAFCLTEAKAATSVRQVRHFHHNDYTRIVLDTSGPVSYEVSRHHQPERIAVNLRGTHASATLEGVSIDRGGVQRVRVNRLSWGTQVVLDLDGPTESKHFSLPSGSGRPDRIVIDVFASSDLPPRTRTVTTAATSEVGTARPIMVAVDAGHGGKDPGAIGRYRLVEKKLTLDIARRVAALINERPGFEAILTRTSDRYLGLEQRTEIARQHRADVFVSVHLNTAPKRSARGAEVYFVSPLGAARSASEMLANPKRTAHEYGLESTTSSDVLHMLVDVNQQSILARGEMLASSILQALASGTLLPTRAVKQKSFRVLKQISMPSVLVEAGFISNAADAELFRDAAGRERVAKAIAAGTVDFLNANPPQRDRESMVVHKVRRGDTLWKISRQYNTSVTRIRAANRLKSSSVLRVGQELLVTRGR